MRAFVMVGLMMVSVSSAMAEDRTEARTEARRAEVMERYDKNADGALKGAELTKIKKELPRLYEGLLGFCEAALASPRDRGVVLPTDEREARKQKCTKCRVDDAYIAAWLRGGETPREERLENQAP